MAKVFVLPLKGRVEVDVDMLNTTSDNFWSSFEVKQETLHPQNFS